MRMPCGRRSYSRKGLRMYLCWRYALAISVLACLGASATVPSSSGLDPADPAWQVAGRWFSGAASAVSALAKPFSDVFDVAVENAAAGSAELLALHSATVAGAAELIRELLWSQGAPTAQPIPRTTPTPRTEPHNPSMASRSRRVQAAPPAAPSNFTLPRANMTCSGIGILLPSPGVTVYTCNGAEVGAAAFDAVTALQGPGGATAANVAALAAAVSAAVGGDPNGSVPLGAFIDPSTPLPANWSAGLAPGTLVALAAALGVTPSALTAATTAGDLFPGGSTPVPAAAAFVLLALPLETVAALVNGTRCTSATQAAATRGGRRGSCACPLDYTGDDCELPRHYACSVVVADPVYHACVASNGAGFEAPRPGAPARLLAPAAGGLAARNYSYLGAAGDALAYVAGGGSGSRSGAGAGLLAAHDAALSDPGHPYGAGSGVAVPVSVDALASLSRRLGLTDDGDASRLLRADAAAGDPGPTVYAPAADGDPQCLWLNARQVAAAAGTDSGAAAAAAAGAAGGLTGAAYFSALAAASPHPATGWPAGVVPLRLRVRCAFTTTPGSAGLTAGRTLVDPRGSPYGRSHAARDPGSPAARLAMQYTHPPVYADVAATPAGAWRCNGTILTGAGAAAALGARGFNASAPPPGRAPYFGGVLSCVEAAMAYAAGGPAEEPPFALSQPPLLPLALLVTPVSPVALAPEPAALVPLPLDALAGGADVVVPLHLAALEGPGGGPRGLWAGGRLVLEARVVQAPEGAALGPPQEGQGPLPGPLPPLPLEEVLAAVLPPADPEAAAAWWVRVPLLLGGPVARVVIDDAGWAEPVLAPDTAPLAVGVSLGVAAALGAGAWWLQRRYDWWGKCRRDIF